MKTIKFKIPGHTLVTDENGAQQSVETLAEVSMPYSAENLALAQSEAYGEVSVEEDGLPEPEVTVSTEGRFAALEAKFAAMEAAYTEGVTEA